MLDLKVHGTGCATCNRPEADTGAATRLRGLDCRLAKVTDPDAIACGGVPMTPDLVANGSIVVSGKAPPPEEIGALLPSG